MDMQQSYQSVLQQVIFQMAEHPYSHSADAKDGVGVDIAWGGKPLYRAAASPRYYCVGAVAEVVTKTLKRLGFERHITHEKMREFRKHLYIYEQAPVRIDGAYTKGGPGGMVALGWGQMVDIKDAQLGDLAQIWHVHEETGHCVAGHAVIVTGQGERAAKRTINDWSASPLLKGIGTDWHYHKYTKERDGKRYHRKIFVGRWDFDAMMRGK